MGCRTSIIWDVGQMARDSVSIAEVGINRKLETPSDFCQWEKSERKERRVTQSRMACLTPKPFLGRRTRTAKHSTPMMTSIVSLTPPIPTARKQDTHRTKRNVLSLL